MAAKHPDIDRTHLTPKLICDQLGVSIDPVLGWIHSGELKASNVSRSSSRPRWLIAKEDLAQFLEARSNQQPPKKNPRPARKSKLVIREII